MKSTSAVSVIENVVKSGLQGEKALAILNLAIENDMRALLPSISPQIQKSVAAGSALEALEILRFFSKNGFSDPPLALAAAVSIRREISDFQVSDLIGACAALSKHKTRPTMIFEKFIIPELTKNLQYLSPRGKLSILESFNSLRIDLPPEFFPSLLDLDEKSDLLRFAFTLCLPVAPQPLLFPCLEKLIPLLTPELKWWSENMRPHDHWILMQIRAYVRYCRREEYDNLSPSSRETLAKLNLFDFPIPEKNPSVLLQRASTALKKLRVAHSVNSVIGPFLVDIKERDRKIIWEMGSRDKYVSCVVGAPDRLATVRLQERVLKAMGYKVVQLPYWHWQRITDKKQRAEYMKNARFGVIKDKREDKPRELSDQSIDPCSFDAKAAAFDYVGETFFKPEQLRRPWSWSRHRAGDLPTILTL